MRDKLEAVYKILDRIMPPIIKASSYFIIVLYAGWGLAVAYFPQIVTCSLSVISIIAASIFVIESFLKYLSTWKLKMLFLLFGVATYYIAFFAISRIAQIDIDLIIAGNCSTVVGLIGIFVNYILDEKAKKKKESSASIAEVNSLSK